MQLGNNASTRSTITYDLGIKLLHDTKATGKKMGKDRYALPIEQAMSVYAQYVLAKAGLTDGSYTSRAEMEDAARKLKEADLRTVRGMRYGELERRKELLILYFEGSKEIPAFDSIRIQNFNPNIEKLEALLNTYSLTAEEWGSVVERYYKPTFSQKHAPMHPTARNQDA